MTNKKKPPYVTEARLTALLARWAKAADASITLKLAGMEARLRAEFGGHDFRYDPATLEKFKLHDVVPPKEDAFVAHLQGHEEAAE